MPLQGFSGQRPPGLGRAGVGRAPLKTFTQPATVKNPGIWSGVTRDSALAALANCLVVIVEATGGPTRTATNSDSEGKFSVGVPIQTPLVAIGYLSGAPDVAGSSTLATITYGT